MKKDSILDIAVPAKTIENHFCVLDDPRMVNKTDHKLLDIITITICAIICGADTFTDIEQYGIAKYDWFKQFLDLPNGMELKTMMLNIVKQWTVTMVV